MRRTAFLLLCVLALTSCTSAPVLTGAPLPAAVSDAPVPVGVQYRVGAAEYARAGLSIPGNLVGCGATAVGEAGQVLARFLKCAAESLVPTPTPSAYMVPLAPAAAAPAAAPCAPAAPSGRWVWQPSVSEALPAPPAGTVCVNGSCAVAGR